MCASRRSFLSDDKPTALAVACVRACVCIVSYNLCVGKQVSPFLIPALISNTASGVVAIEHKARGPNFGVVSACATGTHAIGTAMDFMLRGEVRLWLWLW